MWKSILCGRHFGFWSFLENLLVRFGLRIRKLDSGGPERVVDQEAVDVVPSDFARIPGNVPPPRHWLDNRGNTRGCVACETRKGHHNKECLERYREWV